MIRDTGGDYNVLRTLRVPVLTPRGNNNVEVSLYSSSSGDSVRSFPVSLDGTELLEHVSSQDFPCILPADWTRSMGRYH